VVEIFDPSGKKLSVVYSGRLTKGDHRMAVSNSIAGLPNGIYWFRIISAEDQLSLKFVKQ
jgi:hypothetical protein